MAIAAMVFDFDGLMMDTERTLVASWQAEWLRHGFTLDLDEFLVDHGGDADDERYAALARRVGPVFDRSHSHARRVEHRDRLNAELGLLPGIGMWLDQAAELGLRLAIASSSPRAWVEPLLARSGRLGDFELLACGDEVAAAKPDPAVYRLALRRMGLDGAEAVAVEDSAHGARAARAAGLRCLAIPGAHARGAFDAAELLLASAADRDLDAVLLELERGPTLRGVDAGG